MRTVIVTEFISLDVAALRPGEGGPIQVASSGQLAQALHKAGLVDH